MPHGRRKRKECKHKWVWIGERHNRRDDGFIVIDWLYTQVYQCTECRKQEFREV